MSTIVLRIDTTALHEGAIEDLKSALYAQVEGTGAFVISHPDMAHRWTVKGAAGRCLAHEGVPTLSIIQERNAFPSVAIDMLTAYMCDVLNATDLDHLMRVWNDDPRSKK